MQIFAEALLDAKFASQWIVRNRVLFSDDIYEPWVVNATPEAIAKRIEPQLQQGASIDVLRNNTLFNFHCGDDLRLFIKFCGTAMKLGANVCLDGQEFINNNVTIDQWFMCAD